MASFYVLMESMLAEPMPRSRRMAPKWTWSIYGLHLRGALPEGIPLQGLAEGLEGAKASQSVTDGIEHSIACLRWMSTR